MPNLIIDDREILVPPGTKVIQAAERLGIMIPRFCFHEALGAVGACRVCAVKFLEGPVRGVQMSCMLDAEDGMVVSTTDPEAVDFRKHVIEWLMLHHPLDCPVCDEGGHCLLQDETVSGGHGIRRYLGRKRTYEDQDLGPFVQHEMNRCIHCFRCRRFYQEFAGGRDLGALQIGNRMYFGRFQDGVLESPFSGNLIDICPTGVFTDKPARFKGRRWDFERAPSVCIHCSLGCNTTGSARYREMIRQEARFNRFVNGYFICDRGRFGLDFANHSKRPRKALVREKEMPYSDAVRSATAELRRIATQHGAGSVAGLGSFRSSLQTQGSLKRLCGLAGWQGPFFTMENAVTERVKSALAGLDERVAVSMAEVQEADFLLALGADPLQEAPVLALAMRQAFRKGAAVAVLDPRPVSLPFDFAHVAAAPGLLEWCASVVVRQALGPHVPAALSPAAAAFYESLPQSLALRSELDGPLAQVARMLESSRRPVIICGTAIVPETLPGLAADLGHLVREWRGWAGLFYILPGPNAFGAALLSAQEAPRSLVEDMESGRIKALVAVENDPFWSYTDSARLAAALDELEFLLVLDHVPSPLAGRAHTLLPTTAIFEHSPSLFVNHEGRVQRAFPIHRGGTPLHQVSGGAHPPRIFLDHVPGGEPLPAHAVLGQVYSGLFPHNGQGLVDPLSDWPALEIPGFESRLLSSGDLEGTRLLPQKRSKNDFASRPKALPDDRGGLELILADRTFGTEELSSYSSFTLAAETPPSLFMHPGDAARIGLEEGCTVSLALDNGEVSLGLCLSPRMSPGVIVMPRHHALGWQKVKRMPLILSEDRVRRR
ncbi:MAG: NADH-quinone oxidoreductase subunit NuoG [Thermodesulfobacteriota bacterium]